MFFLRPLFSLLFLILLVPDGYGQKILLLEKTKKFKRIRHYESDPFAFRLVDEKYAISGRIDLILDYGVVVDGELYRFENIGMVLNYRKYAVFRTLSKSAFMAIPPMLVFTILHRGLNRDNALLLDRNSLQVMGVFAGIGLLFWPFKARKYRLGKKWQLRTIDVTPG